MKNLLKILLSLFILIAGIYAATPLWLPYILARQLPPGWQLETLEAGYPGFAGISVSTLRVKGDVLAADIALTAADIRFSYQGLKTDIGSLSVDVFVFAVDDRTADALTLDDLSLPTTRLTGKLPALTISQLRVALHTAAGSDPGNAAATQPLVLDFRALKLLPGAENSFHLTTTASIEATPAVNGRLDVDVSENSRIAEIRFPASVNAAPWLAVSLEQTDQTQNTTTQIRAVFDAEQANQEWLDIILARGSDGLLTHVTGKLEIQANFAGKKVQNIERMSLATEQLQAEFENGVLIFDAGLRADRNGEKITVTLPRLARIQFQDTSGKIDELITQFFPEIERTAQPNVSGSAEIEPASKLVIQHGGTPSIEFNGDINLGINYTKSGGWIHATDLHIQSTDFPRLDSATANGLISFNWIEEAPFTYTIRDEDSAPVVITADEMNVVAKLTLSNGDLFSTGDGVFIGSHIEPMAASATRVDVSWQNMDLLNLAGELSTKTQGLATVLKGENWSGFDIGATYTLLSDASISGTGTLNFDSGPVFPIKFTGNAEAEKWNITLPPATIKLAQLKKLLRVAHIELPETVKLTDGYIDIHGDIVVADEITAEMIIKGHEMGASMLESSAHKAGLALSTRYGNIISASGPVSIEAVALAGGVDVTNIRADLKLENMDTFGLKNLHAEVFDGQLHLDNLRFSANRIEDTTIELSHINLGRLLAFTDIDGLEGTGFLEVFLPTGSDETGIYVKNGTFSASGPGRLAYTKQGVAGSNIGLQALENFHFNDLSGTINYQSDGAYQMAIHLEGKNPDLYGGHPIVFNLNIGGSLPELFEAMFMTGSFEESILKQIRAN